MTAVTAYLEGADPEQAVDGVDLQPRRHGRGVRDLEPELGLDDLARLVEGGVVLVRVNREVIILAARSHAWWKQGVNSRAVTKRSNSREMYKGESKAKQPTIV